VGPLETTEEGARSVSHLLSGGMSQAWSRVAVGSQKGGQNEERREPAELAMGSRRGRNQALGYHAGGICYSVVQRCHSFIHQSFNECLLSTGCWWLILVILAIWETEIRRTGFEASPGKLLVRTPSPK
jgi:hypothetical protein